MPSDSSTASQPSSAGRSSGQSGPEADRTSAAALKSVADLITAGKAKNIVVLTGAGISTSAGIPDFRSPETGLYANLQALNLPFPEAVFELGYFRKNPKPFWTLAKEIYPGKHFPTPTHYFLHLLHRKGVLRRVFSQNIDTLEHLSGLPAGKIIEAHGSFATAHCLECGVETSTEYVLASGVRKGEIVRCAEDDCDGLVKPDIVFFGEGLPDKFFKHLSDLTKADLIIVIGTSLQVQPFSLLPDKAGPSVPRLLINREAVGPFEALESGGGGMDDHLARIMGRGRGRRGDMLWKGDADEGVRQLCAELGWENELDEMIAEGRVALEEKWRGMEFTTEPASSGTVNEERVDNLAEGSKPGPSGREVLTAASDAPEVTPGPDETSSASHGDGEGDEDPEVGQLQKAIERDLKLADPS